MSRLADLKATSSLSDLALVLNFKPAALAYLVYKLAPAAKYTTFTIAKSGGGTRTIDAPIPQLKRLQQNLAQLLQDCWDEIQLKAGRKDAIAHGFRRGRSIISNARKHRNRNFVLNVDLKDFFPSLHFGRVRGYFLKDRSFALDLKIATLIAQIACHNKALPQGSPCSPVISNLIGHILDIQLAALATNHSCTYSRYADDLTFSTNEAVFPKAIAEVSSSHVAKAGKGLIKVVTHNDFEINPLKTRLQYHDSQQVVTGLIVNRRVNVPYEYRHRIRAMAHALFRTGAYEIRDSAGASTPGTAQQLHGMFSFVDSIDLHQAYIRFANSDKRASMGKPIEEISVKEFGTLTSQSIGPLSPRERLFRRFLIYKEFFATANPVIVCEGETDNIYLLHAIHSLGAKFPQLLGPPSAGKSRLKVRLFKYVKSRSGRLLGLGSGGGTVLKSLIESFMNESERFLAPSSKFPCILLLDNDSGATAVEGMLKKHGIRLPPNGFVHVAHNLYVMRTPPLPGKPQTAIEDFFTKKTLSIQVDGKSFHGPKAGFDPAKHYGKVVFAHKVVRPKASSINFSRFAAILSIVVDIMNQCATKPATPKAKTP
jgi:retron-type reverse transcriptase